MTLQQAIEREDIQAVKRILAKTKVRVNERNPAPSSDGFVEGGGYLDAASFLGNVEIVKVLIRYGANPNGRDNLGNTPLIMAVEDSPKGIAVVKYLLDHGADRNLVNNQGRTALDLALKNGFDKCASVLETYRKK